MDRSKRGSFIGPAMAERYALVRYDEKPNQYTARHRLLARIVFTDLMSGRSHGVSRGARVPFFRRLTAAARV